MPTKINIAVPAYQGMYCGELVRSLYSTFYELQKVGVATALSDVDCCDIEFARNYLISSFYFRKRDCSHILFIDNDMGFDPQLIVDMLSLNKEVVGVVYPKRQIDLSKIHRSSHLEFPKARAASLDYIVGKVLPERIGKFARVTFCGAGVLLISRTAIDRMIVECPDVVDEKKFKGLAVNSKLPKFLTPFCKLVVNERELAEDLSFCYRWTELCKGEIWASIDHNIQHVGRFVYEGKYTDHE